MQLRNTHSRIAFATALVAVVLSVPSAWAAGSDSTATGTSVTMAVSGGALEAILFYIVAAMTVVSALGVCIARNIVRMAVWLFIALAAVAMLYFLLAATFLGAIQLMVYAGGTLILLVFGVMLTSKSPWVKLDASRIEQIGAFVVCGVLCLGLCTVLLQAGWSLVSGPVPGVSVADIGRRLLTIYLVPFEAAGVLLMIVMVGAAHLARQEK